MRRWSVAAVVAVVLLSAALLAPGRAARGAGDVEFRPPFSDAARDTDGDGLFDEIVIHVPLHLNASASYRLNGVLWLDDPPGFAWPPTPESRGPWHDGPGDVVHDLVFRGAPLYGTSAKSLNVTIGAYGRPDVGVGPVSYTTRAYDPSSFVMRPACGHIVQGAQSSTPLDTDADGLADLLRLDAAVDVETAGDYLVGASDFFDRVEAGRILTLPAGPSTVSITVGGIALNRSTVVPRWFDLALERLDALSPTYCDTGFMEVPIPAGAFAGRPVARLSGTVRYADTGLPAYLSRVVAEDPATKFTTYADVDASGVFSMDLYNGTFTLLAGLGWVGLGPFLPPDRQPQPRALRVDVEGSTFANLVVDPAPRDPLRYTVNLADWTGVTVTVDHALRYGNESYRFYADLYGDGDGVANASELSLYLSHVPVSTSWPPPWWLPGTPFAIQRDALPFRLVSATAVTDPADGDPTSTAPLHATTTLGFAAPPFPPGTSPSGSPHTLSVWLGYDDAAYEVSGELRIPSGYGVTVAAGPNITVSGGEGVWAVDPGAPPTDWDLRYGGYVQAVSPGTAGILPVVLLAIAVGVVAIVAVVAVARRRSRTEEGGRQGLPPPKSP